MKKKVAKKVPKQKKPSAEDIAILKKMEELWILVADDLFKKVTPHKCFIIISDEKGNGISRSTPNFTQSQFAQWADTIKKHGKLTL